MLLQVQVMFVSPSAFLQLSFEHLKPRSDSDVHILQECVEPDSRTSLSGDSGQNGINWSGTFPEPACVRTRRSVSPVPW